MHSSHTQYWPFIGIACSKGGRIDINGSCLLPYTTWHQEGLLPYEVTPPHVAPGNNKRRLVPVLTVWLWLCLTRSRESLLHQKVLIPPHGLDKLSHLRVVNSPSCELSYHRSLCLVYRRPTESVGKLIINKRERSAGISFATVFGGVMPS